MSSQKTPLYEFHKSLGARFVPFAGWEMPVQYSSILEEHKAVREEVGLFDVSHMGEAWITGPQAENCINTLVTNDISRIADNQAQYTVMCQPDGGCVDDLIVYRFSRERYLLCLNAGNTPKDIAWITNHTKDFDCELQDASQDYALLALQGPLAEEVIAQLIPGHTPLKRFTFQEINIEDVSIILSATGYTGENGYELYCPAAQANILAGALIKAGKPYNIKPCGLGARDSLRLEAGYPLYGHEINETISPLQGGLSWVVKLKKESFVGKDALLKEKEAGLKRKIHFFTLEGRRIAREGTPVYAGEIQVGEVRSGSHSPLLGHPIGSALIDENRDPSISLEVDLRGNRAHLNLKKPPLHL